MHWPRVTRKTTRESDLTLSHQRSNEDAVSEVSPVDPLVTPPPPADPTDPGLSRMFSDAALYEKIIAACPDALKDKVFFSAVAPVDQSDEEPAELTPLEEGEEEKEFPPPTPGLSQDVPPVEPPEEPKLTPEEVVDLLEQEFGALAPLGEEKLLLEEDAAFFKDVVVLVGHSPATPPSSLF